MSFLRRVRSQIFGCFWNIESLSKVNKRLASASNLVLTTPGARPSDKRWVNRKGFPSMRCIEIHVAVLVETKGRNFIHGNSCKKVPIHRLRRCSEGSVHVFKPFVNIGQCRLLGSPSSAADFILITSSIAVGPRLLMTLSFDSWLVHYNSFLIQQLTPMGLLIVV
jgi:hypothetical protein